jgi:hypothetical protein
MPIAWRPGKEFLAQDTLRLQPLIQVAWQDRGIPGRMTGTLPAESAPLSSAIHHAGAPRMTPQPENQLGMSALHGLVGGRLLGA